MVRAFSAVLFRVYPVERILHYISHGFGKASRKSQRLSRPRK
jgi:hypothetical protein